jgi:Concanavalin A-like lectin/glucanases superfamily
MAPSRVVRPFAYNTGSPISGTTQLGDLAIGKINVEYSTDYGGVRWWDGPDENFGYVIAHPTPSGNQPNPISVSAYLGFWRSKFKTDESFLNLANVIPPRRGLTPFTGATEAYDWLNANGFWTSYTCYSSNGLQFDVDASDINSYPTSGTSWYNLVGSQYATLLNGASFSTNNGGLIYFNGPLSQYGTIPNLGLLSAFTVSVWYKLNTLPSAGGYFPALVSEIIGGAGNAQINFVVGATNFGNNQLMSGGFHNGSWHSTTGFPIVQNEWVFVTLTYDGNELKLYKDDSLYSSSVIGQSTTSSGLGSYINRRWDNPDFYDVDIPVIQIYSRDLSLAEIQKNYSCSSNRYYNPVTATPTPTLSQTPTLTPTPQTTATPTSTQTPTPSITASQTVTPTPSITASQTVTPTLTQTPTNSATVTNTPTLTQTPTNSATVTNTPTPTSPNLNFLLFEDGSIATAENNDNIQIDIPPTPSPTPTITATPTLTQTPTPSITVSPTLTQTPTTTITPTPSITSSQTPTLTQTPTKTASPTPTATGLLTPASYLVIGGGAGGGANWGGGGGAGQVVTGTTNFSSNQTYTITIGNGGTGASGGGQGTNGGTTTFSGLGLSVSAVGGGGGGYNINPSTASNGASGASGGGAGAGGTSRATGGSATAGFSGGSTTIDNVGAGGGGGSTSAGANGSATNQTGGAGGNGTTSSITGSAVAYAGGGGGGGGTAATTASGGTGGGGNGGVTFGGAGANATGYGSGGGGGATNNGNGGNGSKGVVIISVPTNEIGTYTGAPIVSTNGTNTVLTFTGNGTYVATSIAPTPTQTTTQTPTPTLTQTPTNTPNLQGFNYTNFASTGGTVSVGNVSLVSNILYLTTATTSQIGNVYRTSAIQYNRNFSAQWEFTIGGGTGADGYCVQWTTTNNTIGGAGASVGRIAASSTINAIAFNTFNPLNGVTWYKNNSSQSGGTSPSVLRQTLYYWLDYNHAGSSANLYISTTSTKPGSAQFIYSGFTFDSTNYYMGFGAATGGSTDNHELINWKLTFT